MAQAPATGKENGREIRHREPQLRVRLNITIFSLIGRKDLMVESM